MVHVTGRSGRHAAIGLVAPILVGALAAGAADPAPIVVDRSARRSLALTVYQAGAPAIVRDVRRAPLPAGRSVVRAIDVSPDLDPHTIGLAAGDGVAVLRQRFRWDLGSDDALLTRWIGREIDLVETDELLRTQTTSATLLAVRPRRTFRIGDRLLLDHPGRIALPLDDTELVTRPTVEWTIEAGRAGTRDLEVVYATAGLSWSADYTLRLADDASAASLTGWVTLSNAGVVSYDDARVAVIAGRPRRVRPPTPPIAYLRHEAAAMAADEAGAPMATESEVLDYRRYLLPGAVTLAPGDTVQVRLLQADQIPIRRRYHVQGRGPWPGRRGGDPDDPLPVEVRLDFDNAAASGLGRALPAGTVRVWAPAADDAPAFAGEDLIDHVAPDRPVRLTAGQATDISATRRQIEHRQIGERPYRHESAAAITLHNASEREAAITVHEPMTGAWTVVESSHTPEQVDARTLGFTVTLAAGADDTITYRVRTGG